MTSQTGVASAFGVSVCVSGKRAGEKRPVTSNTAAHAWLVFCRIVVASAHAQWIAALVIRILWFVCDVIWNYWKKCKTFVWASLEADCRENNTRSTSNRLQWTLLLFLFLASYDAWALCNAMFYILEQSLHCEAINKRSVKKYEA